MLVTVGRAASAPRLVSPDKDSDQSLSVILGLLRERSKHDLTLYKSTTLKRRIERRMGVIGLDTLAGYEHFVRENPQELDLLFNELLIGVTSFFRDPAIWQELKDAVLPALLARHTPGTQLRTSRQSLASLRKVW